MAAGKKFLIYLILLTCFIFGPALVYYTKNCDCLNSYFLKDISYDPTSNESKWVFLRTVALQLASFLLIHSFMVMSIRIISQKSSPATHEDPTSIKVINRVISNTLEQSFIFLILLAYFIFDGPAEKFSPTFILNLGSWFILGRVIFSIGYLLGTWLGFPQMRGYGFALTAVVNIFLVQHIFYSHAYLTGPMLGL